MHIYALSVNRIQCYDISVQSIEILYSSYELTVSYLKGKNTIIFYLHWFSGLAAFDSSTKHKTTTTVLKKYPMTEQRKNPLRILKQAMTCIQSTATSFILFSVCLGSNVHP